MRTSDVLEIGTVYTRKQLRQLFGVTDARIDTGIFQPKGHESVWLFVTERKTRDRPQCKDFLRDDVLEWDGQTAGHTDALVIQHQDRGLELLLFWRRKRDEYPGGGFRYLGRLRHLNHSGAHPAHFQLRLLDYGDTRLLEAEIAEDLDALSAEEDSEQYEGVKTRRYTSRYERNPKLRADAVRIHGTTCQVCGFDFEDVYGSRGRDFIEVHHRKPISTLGASTRVNPRTDMVVLCSNCHRMIHRRKQDVLTPEQLKQLVMTWTRKDV